MFKIPERYWRILTKVQKVQGDNVMKKMVYTAWELPWWVAVCCGLCVWAFVAGGECWWECQWLVDYFGGFLRLSACLGDALGVGCGPLPFLSIFPFVAWPLMRSLQCSVSHLSIAVFGFCWYSFQLSPVSGF